MSDFDKLINASDLIDWIMESYPDWCEGDVRAIVNHIDEMPSVTRTWRFCPSCGKKLGMDVKDKSADIKKSK